MGVARRCRYNPYGNGIASIVISIILAIVANILAQKSKGLLISAIFNDDRIADSSSGINVQAVEIRNQRAN
jgi:hypothetical protein